MNKKELKEKIKECMGGNVGALRDFLDILISECHQDNETRRGEDFIVKQGEIKAYRDLQRMLTKQKNS